jgi:hypothetical protein
MYLVKLIKMCQNKISIEVHIGKVECDNFHNQSGL